MRWADSIDEKNGDANNIGANTGAGGGGSTTKDIGNANPPTQWSPTASQSNQKYEASAQKRGTTKQNSKGSKASTPAPWNQRGTTSRNNPPKATGDIGNRNPANRVTSSPSSKNTTVQVRTAGGDLALRARAMRSGGGGGVSRNASAAGNGFINRR